MSSSPDEPSLGALSSHWVSRSSGSSQLCSPLPFGFLFLQFPDFSFHFLARLERHNKLGRNIHLATSSWVPCPPCCSHLDFEHSEVAKLDSSIFHKRLDDRVKRLLDDFFRLQLRQTQLVRNRLNDLFLRHVLCSRTGNGSPRYRRRIVPSLCRIRT